MSSRGPDGECPPDFLVIPSTCAPTASRAQSTRTRAVSSTKTVTSRPTTSRATSSRSRAIGAATSAPGDPSSGSRRSRCRSRSSRSSSSCRSCHALHACRCRSRWHSGALHTRCRSPARRCGRNHRRQIRHGRLRVIHHERHPLHCSLARRPAASARVAPGPSSPAHPPRVSSHCHHEGSVLASEPGFILASGEASGQHAAGRAARGTATALVDGLPCSGSTVGSAGSDGRLGRFPTRESEGMTTPEHRELWHVSAMTRVGSSAWRPALDSAGASESSVGGGQVEARCLRCGTTSPCPLSRRACGDRGRQPCPDVTAHRSRAA